MSNCDIYIDLETTEEALPKGVLSFGLSFALHPNAALELLAVQIYLNPTLLCYLALRSGLYNPKQLLEHGVDIIEDAPTHHISLSEPRDESPSFNQLLKRVESGLLSHAPELCSEGVNGTYFLRDNHGDIVAVFKPNDEEGNSPDNPKKTESLSKCGVRRGEAAAREVAASIINEHCGGYFGVPVTRMVTLCHPYFNRPDGTPRTKTGSLQAFVKCDGNAGDIGPNAFPLDQVQRLAILDMLIYNTDRHEGNILYQKTQEATSIVPIDHGFSLPDSFGSAWFDWVHYPQAKKPLLPHHTDFVENLDTEALCRALSPLIDGQSLDTLRVCAQVLKKGARRGRSPSEMASFMSRKNPKEKCTLEKLVETVGKEDFMEKISQAIEENL